MTPLVVESHPTSKIGEPVGQEPAPVTVTELQVGVYRMDGPTPAGGVYAIAHFRDAAHNLVPQHLAVRGEVTEYDADGNEVGRGYLNVNR